MILRSAVVPSRNWSMIINNVSGFVRNSSWDLPRCCPNIGSRRLGAATEFPIIAQCKPPVQILKGFLLHKSACNCRAISTLHGNGNRL